MSSARGGDLRRLERLELGVEWCENEVEGEESAEVKEEERLGGYERPSAWSRDSWSFGKSFLPELDAIDFDSCGVKLLLSSGLRGGGGLIDLLIDRGCRPWSACRAPASSSSSLSSEARKRGSWAS